MYRDLFFDKVACCSIIEKRLQHNCFTVKFEKFLRNLMYRTLANGCFWLHSFKFYISKAVLSLQQNKYVQSLTPSSYHEYGGGESMVDFNIGEVSHLNFYISTWRNKITFFMYEKRLSISFGFTRRWIFESVNTSVILHRARNVNIHNKE